MEANGCDQEEDLYLSDIHVEQEQNDRESIRIEFALPRDEETEPLKVDSDGDFESPVESKKCLLRMEHAMETRLSHVGLQLWRASLFLSDFLLNNVDIIKDKVVVELGAGLGLTSFIASIYARLIFATDLNMVIKRAKTNFEANRDVLNQLSTHSAQIRFKSLSWFNHDTFLQQPNDEENGLNDQDLSDLRKTKVILAADVIYDDLLTIPLMNTIYKLLTFGDRQPKICYLANEKRINFSAVSLKEGDTSYDYFMTCLSDLNDFVDSELGYKFQVEEIKLNDDKSFVKYVKSYNRNKFLYLWKITSIPV